MTRLLLALALAGLVSFLIHPILTIDRAWASSSSLEDARAELSEAKAELKAFQTKLDKLAEKGEQAQDKLDTTRGHIEEVQAKISKTETDLALAREQLADRLADIYKSRGSEALSALNAVFTADDMSLTAVAQRLAMVNRAAEQDHELITAVVARLNELQELTADLEDQKRNEERDVEEYVAIHDEALIVLEEAKNDYNRLKKRVAQLEAEEQRRQEEARRLAEARAAAKEKAEAETRADAKEAAAAEAKAAENAARSAKAAVGSAGWVFPVQGPNSFTNSFGAPRSGGRSHKGTDIMTPLNAPVVAVVNGVISGAKPYDSGLGGVTIHLRGDDGNAYYYAHLTSIKEGIASGVRVAAGQVIGFAGNTGNARGGETHLHFEIRPGGGAAINPYSTLIKYR